MQRWPFPSNRRVLYRKQDSSKDNRFQTNGENPRRKIEFVQATSTHCPICLKLVVSHSSSSYMEKRSLTKRGYRSEPTEQSLSSSLCALRFQLLHYIESPMAATSIQKQITKSLSVQTPLPIFVLIEPVQSSDLASSAKGHYGLNATRPQFQ